MIFGKKKSLSEQIADFWDWFSSKAAEYKKVDLLNQAQVEKMLNEIIDKRLQKIDENLTVEIGTIDDATHDLVISADGIKAGFDKVKEVVAAAPQVPGWKVTAFKQPKDVSGLRVQLGPKELTINDIWYSLTPDTAKKKIDTIIIVHTGLPLPNELAGQIGFIALDGILGEYDVATKLGAIDFLNYPEETFDGSTEIPYQDGTEETVNFKKITGMKEEFDRLSQF